MFAKTPPFKLITIQKKSLLYVFMRNLNELLLIKHTLMAEDNVKDAFI